MWGNDASLLLQGSGGKGVMIARVEDMYYEPL